MEADNSLLFSQEPAIYPYRVPNKPVQISVLLLFSHMCLSLPRGLLPSDILTKIVYEFFTSPIMTVQIHTSKKTIVCKLDNFLSLPPPSGFTDHWTLAAFSDS
jgi:hypothetical protein